MVLNWWKMIVMPRMKQLNIYREYCKSISSEQRLRENPYYDKYADKISELQNTSPEEYKSVLKEKLASRTVNPHTVSKKPGKIYFDNTEVPRFHGQKELNQILKLETVEEKSASEIELIWKQYHQFKDGLYAVLTKEIYEKMYSRLHEYPTFVFPLPRSEGYEFILHQFLEHACYFTSLLNYQAYKENAPVCLTLTFFTELIEKKGIVLMRGEYDNKALKIQEAQCLANQLQLYYECKDEKKENLLWTFNKQPETFRHMDLVSNFEYNLGK